MNTCPKCKKTMVQFAYEWICSKCGFRRSQKFYKDKTNRINRKKN